MLKGLKYLCLIPLVVSTSAFGQNSKDSPAQRAQGEFARLVTIPAVCEEVSQLGFSELGGPRSGARSEPSPTCRALVSCLVPVRSQVVGLVEYLKRNPAVYRAIEDQAKAMRVVPQLFSWLERLPRTQTGDVSKVECAYLWQLKNQYLALAPTNAASFAKAAAVGQALLVKVRAEYTGDQVEYKDLIAFNDRYPGIESLERAYAAYRKASLDDDVAGLIRERPIFMKELDIAKARKQFLTRQSEQISRYQQALSDLAAAVNRESLTAYADQQMGVTLDALKGELDQLSQTPPAKRGDISAKLELVDTQFHISESAVDDARARKQLLTGQSVQVVKHLETLADTAADIDREGLSRFVDEQTQTTVGELRNKLQKLSQITPDKRGDIAADLGVITARIQDIDTAIASARALKNQTEQIRRTLIENEGAAKRILDAATSPVKPAFDEQFVKSARDLINRFRELGSVELWTLQGRQEDIAEATRQLSDLQQQVSEVKAEIAQISELSAGVRTLTSKIDGRGRHLLDASTSAQLGTLAASVKVLNAAKIPLTPDGRRQLADANSSLGQLERTVDAVMDQAEKRLLVRTLPARNGVWQFKSDIDKVTNEEWVRAFAEVKGAEAKYQLSLVCRTRGPELLISTFEPDSTTGKRIPWNMDINALAAHEYIRLRIDSKPAFGAELEMRAYGNQGRIDMTGDFAALAHSYRLVLADIFPDDQVEVTTVFPAQFSRLCELIAPHLLQTSRSGVSPQ